MVFTDNDAADRHMRQAAHYANYCQDCDQVFQSENNLRMHLNSSIHRGRSISCPFCSIKYTTASGLSHHLETGSCPRAPQLNRQTILQLIRKRDPHGAITIRQLEWYPEAQVTYSATDRAFNGSDWECYLCHKLFGGVRALEQHLNSPAHQQRVYHCPKRACGKEFITLAGLFSHLESESCGYIRFEKVQQQVGAVFSSNRMIAFV